jgi:hypothetical protein
MKNEVKKKMHAVNERCCTKVTERQESIRKSSRRVRKKCRDHAIARDENAAAIDRVHVKHSRVKACRESNGGPINRQKFIIFTLHCIYNDVAKSSREHDQWRLSMMLSSFLVVAPQWESFRAVSLI